jgi:hypothetical protein
MADDKVPGRSPTTDRRRIVDRRETTDRREEIRFEPKKDDRRQGKNRRRHSGWDEGIR